jgi:adenine-specific DNA-methyltransferase
MQVITQPLIPHVIKYMGSKRSILGYVHDTLFEIRKPGQRLYDVFGGSAVVAGALRNEMPVTCNDIQSYTSVIAGLYLNNYRWSEYPENIVDIITERANKIADQFEARYNLQHLSYDNVFYFESVKAIEIQEKNLINVEFEDENHLFVKYYSGTYWSFKQCVWIDALSSIARDNEYKDTFLYNVILSSLMFAMAYCSQSTGHYAQYRDTTTSNTADMLIYRKKSIEKLFKQKFIELKEFYNESSNSNFEHQVQAQDYLLSLKSSEPNSLIYADPPYQFVHYSRFYHALETLVKYDYPEVKHKGRYREDRHQSPFCIKTKVSRAFKNMFQIAYNKHSDLVLSYSDNGMITMEQLLSIANKVFSHDYVITQKELAYNHSTMGRSGDKSRNVCEVLLVIEYIG